MKNLITLLAVISLIGCFSNRAGKVEFSPHQDLQEKVANIQDSITVGGMTIHNAFKHQILAHTNKTFDNVMIINKVYKPNQHVFDNCLGLIFGEENREKFGPEGMHKWNESLLDENEDQIRQKIGLLDSVDINQLFISHLTAVQEITDQNGEGSWLLYFGPNGFQIFGGCDRNAMVLDMMGKEWNSKWINKLFAHEIEHLVFEPILENDPHGDTGLGITLDEGLAVYFTHVYLRQNLESILYGNQTRELLRREKEIFNALEPFLFIGEDKGCPIYKHCGRSEQCESIVKGLPKEIEGELCYFLGFRIIEKYVEKHGKDSWKDLHSIPFKEFYEKSGYKEFVEGL